MQPFNSLLIAFLDCGTDYLPVICNCDMPVFIRIAVSFSKTINQNRRVLISVIDDTGHRDNASFNPKFLLKFFCMVTESNQDFLKFLHCLRDLKLQEIQPFLINKTHIPYRLYGRLIGTKLLNPGQCPDMPVYIRTHSPILRIFVKHRFQIRHICINVFLQRNNCAVFPVF